MSGGMIGDFHTHVLPGIDDGSRDTEQSLQMLQLLHRQGVTRVVATPHFYASEDTPRRFLARRQAALEALQAAGKLSGLPELHLGAEVYYFEGISDCEELEALSIAGTSFVLVEMPPAPWSARVLRELQELPAKRGLTPVIAHIDRYLSLWNSRGLLRQLAGMPVLIQANAEFFLNPWTRPMALRLLRAGNIHLLGSDCHNLTDRKPNLESAAQVIRRALGQEVLDAIIRQEDLVLGTGTP